MTYLALELDLFVVAVGDVPLGEAGFAPGGLVSWTHKSDRGGK
jgi:hypothetical protein